MKPVFTSLTTRVKPTITKALPLFFAAAVLAGCLSRSPKADTFTELPDPHAAEASGWENVEPGLNISFVSTDEKYAKSFVPEVTEAYSVKITGWKGERVSAQLLLWAADSIPDIKVRVGGFKNPKSSLPADVSSARFVRYVMTDEFGEGCGYRNKEDFAASLAPDMLDNVESFDMEARTVRPVWITVDIPAGADAGNYTAEVSVKGKGVRSRNLRLELEVIDRILPPASGWQYYLDLWQHPSALARVEGLEVWSDEHFAALEPYMKMLAAAGQKVITATLNKDAWNNQSYDAYEEMIVWTLRPDGTWHYDYTAFDKWVEFVHGAGITQVINCYSLLPWNNELQYRTEDGAIETVIAEPGKPEFEYMWIPFLLDFTRHLEEKGWLGKTNIAIDERSPEQMDIAMALLAEVAPELGIALADNHMSYRKYTHVRDLCVNLYSRMDDADIAARRENGLVNTYYVCCSHEFPNFFTFSPPGEAVYAAWYATAAGYDGMLHWSFMNWVEEPLTDSRFRTWPAGDTYMVYPGARSSIRFERLMEGVQDAEKIRIMRTELEADGSREALERLARLNEIIKRFDTYEPGPDWNEGLNKAKQYLNDISRP